MPAETAPTTMPLAPTTMESQGVEEEFVNAAPGLGIAAFFLVMMLLLVLLFCFIVTVVLAAISLGIFFLLVITGILSTSLVVGLAQRSVGAAFRTAIAMVSACVMAVLCPIAVVAVTSMIQGSPPAVWIIFVDVFVGLAIGAAGGYLIAVAVSRVLVGFGEWLRRRRKNGRNDEIRNSKFESNPND